MAHSLCWVDRISALETRMHELSVSLRILRTELTVAQIWDDSDSLLPNDSARELYTSINLALSGLHAFLEKSGALADDAKPDLIRVYVSLPSEEASLRFLERIADVLRELVEILAHVVNERARSLDPARERDRIESGVRPIAPAAIEPRITWSRISPAPSESADAASDRDGDASDERYVVQVKRLYPIKDDAFGDAVAVNGSRPKAAG
jgi:hypothetical protein